MDRPEVKNGFAVLADELGVAILGEEPLARHTTMRVGGPAEALFLPDTPEKAARLWARLLALGRPPRILGWGSNVIVSDAGVRGAVISTRDLRRDPERLQADCVDVWAGVPVPGLARWAQRQGLSGIEFAEGIPAHVGGAIRMNAGANQSSFAAIVTTVRVAGSDGSIVTRVIGPDDFAYRESFAKREGLFVVGGVLQLRSDGPELIRQRMTAYRDRRRATQPVQARSAGCAFANYAEVSVGALVERLGFKGRRIGDAEISMLHGNFIINRGQASASDIVALLAEIERALTTATGRAPRLEVELWQDQG